uniref:Complement C3-like protein 1 n=1 Tax=Littorina littorea TaxID=31216 RepID=A0A2P1L4B4_LITLI|nr:complement C3-like protein 1 [Littorina littorea]
MFSHVGLGLVLVSSAVWQCMCEEPVADNSPLYFVATPNVLRLETEETVTVTTFGATSAATFSLYLEDYPERRRQLSHRTLVVEKDEIANVSIKLTTGDLISLASVSSDPAYVYLVCETVNLTQASKTETILPLSLTPGYIYIQTDKPVYTPHQTVYMRVIALNEDYKPANWPLEIDVLNPKDLAISRKQDDGNDVIFTDSLRIPDNPVYGNWTVKVKFANGLTTSSAVRFEVREYVLPTFGVTFQTDADQKVLLPSDTHLHTTVTARYVFGKPVRGHVTVTFGLIWHGHVFTLGKKRNLELNETGQAVCTIPISELRLPVESVWFPNGGKLHMEAIVTEYASGKVERARDSSVVFAESLHIIKFTRSSRHFRPGLTYSLTIDVIKANGEPGAKLPLLVECNAQLADVTVQLPPLTSSDDDDVLRTDDKGHLVVHYLIASNVKRLTFKVQTINEGGEPEKETDVHFGAVPFYSPSGTFLQVDATATSAHRRGSALEVGDYVTVTTQYTSSEELSHVNLLVLSRGHIVWQTRTHNLGSNSTTFYFPLTRHMLPGARIVAFSIRGSQLGAEVISDSVWVDMKPTCFGEIGLTLTEDNPPKFRPGDIGSVSVKGLPDMRVGLLAVDEAVYLMNKRSLTRRSVFDSLKEHDLGCGDGRGDSAAAVFRGSGLTILSNTGLATLPRSTDNCRAKAVRRRRATSMDDVCCKEGARMNIQDPQLCHKAAKEVKKLTGLSACAMQFFRCCRDMNRTELFTNSSGRIQGGQDQEEGLFDVTLEDDVMMPLSDETVPIRSNFPESWWFEDFTLGPTGEMELDFALPDSITTWVLQAVGVSPREGLCVAPPLNVTAFRPFFVHVDLPYTAVRLEQLEVRATVYNYMQRSLNVRLFLQSVEGVCYSGVSGKNSEAFVVEVAPNDATSVYFPIVPLEMGKFPVRVFAISAWGRDAVEKTLRVEGEGLEKVHTVSVLLDPSGKRFVRDRRGNQTFSLTNTVVAEEQKQEVQLDLDLPSEVIPDTESCTVSAMGDLLGPTVRGIVDGAEEMLRLPTGCGEQNLIYMGPNVYTMRYLKAVGRLTSTIEKKARAYIRQGLMRQMTFRKDDGSYGTWPHADSSTWLTAFAMKVLCQTNNFVPVDMNATCVSLHWLRTRQRTDGSFMEDVWVTHREMLGGVNGDMSVTAFVLIAMLECPCMEQDRGDMIARAMQYLEHRLEVKQRPLTAAITAYALALAGSEWSREFNMKLMDQVLSTPQGLKYWSYAGDEDFGEEDKPYWYVKKPGALAVETTAYALLTQLTMNDVTASNPIVAWLLQQREEHGSFVSTQDTVIALQALSEYSIKSFSAILDMTCHVTSEVDDKFQKTFSLTREDALVLKSVPEVPTGGKLLFEASGTGVGVMHVDVRFNVPHDNNVCRFDLTVTSRRLSSMLQHFFWQPQHQQRCEPCSMDCDEREEEEEEEDIENFTFPPIIPRIREKLGLDKDRKRQPPTTHTAGTRVGRPMSRIGRIPRGPRARARRSALIASSARVLCIEVCTRYRGDRETGMSVIDVGLFTGYKPITSDLHKLKEKGKVDHYEMSQRSVILYIDEISHEKRHCVKFRTKQVHVVENLQPAKVQVYDYYNPEERCTVFYKPDNASGHLANFCDEQKRICQCLEGRCGTCEETYAQKTWQELYRTACHNTSNALVVKILDRDLEKVGFERLLGVVEQAMHQPGKLQVSVGDKVVLLKRDSCICPRVQVGKSYLLLLQLPKKFKDVEGNQVFVFLLDKRAVVSEYQDPKDRSLSKPLRRQARKLARVARRLTRKRCRTKGKGKRRVKVNRKNKIARALRRRRLRN